MSDTRPTTENIRAPIISATSARMNGMAKTKGLQDKEHDDSKT